MNQEKITALFNDLFKMTIKFVTLTPMFKAMFSMKGVIITAIIIHSILMVNYVSGAGFDAYFINGKPLKIMATLLQYTFDLAVLVVILKIVKQYLRNNTFTILDMAKKQGILSKAEHSEKVSKLHYDEMMKNISYLEKSGLYESEKRQEIEQMVSKHFNRKKKLAAIESAYADGVLTDSEYKEKIKI